MMMMMMEQTLLILERRCYVSQPSFLREFALELRFSFVQQPRRRRRQHCCWANHWSCRMQLPLLLHLFRCGAAASAAHAHLVAWKMVQCSIFLMRWSRFSGAQKSRFKCPLCSRCSRFGANNPIEYSIDATLFWFAKRTRFQAAI